MLSPVVCSALQNKSCGTETTSLPTPTRTAASNVVGDFGDRDQTAAAHLQVDDLADPLVVLVSIDPQRRALDSFHLAGGCRPCVGCAARVAHGIEHDAVSDLHGFALLAG
jgi:hypothetical protein